MIAFERTQDLALVREVMTHPRIYPWITDDGAPQAADFQPVKHAAFWYVLVKDEQCGYSRPLGVFLLTPQGAACWELHTCLLPECRGRRAMAAAAGLAEWIWENTSCRRVVTAVPAYNRAAIWMARQAGMTEYGRNPNSYLKNGKLHDQVLLGLSREE